VRLHGLLWALAALVPALALADADIDTQIKRVESALARIQAEQQAVYQQFQMVQELKRQARQQAQQDMSRWNAMPPQNYDDQVREQQARESSQDRYRDEADRLYDRYRELEDLKRPLLERLNQLAQERE
jgi:Skp family chaperone for outer membrane proteins